MKKILFIAALHGNEEFSIGVLQEIEKEYPKDKYNYDWVIGNPEALKKNVRFTEVDLNRNAPGDSKAESYEERRAAELIELSKDYSAVIDIHGTEANSQIFSLVTNPTIENLLLAAALPILKSVVWASKSSLTKGPLTQFMHCPAVEIECGPKADPKIHDELKEILIQILTKRETSLDNLLEIAKEKEFYLVYGKAENVDTTDFKEFKEAVLDNEVFYPLLVNSYKVGSTRKMKKMNFFEIVAY